MTAAYCCTATPVAWWATCAQRGGICTADLFPQATGDSRKGSIVAAYPYVDETGALLFEVVRFDPKDFRQRRPDGRSGWTWNINGVRRVLYRLNELAGADEVFIVEGEKDADSLRALGFVATTVPGGAGKWRAEYADAFRNDQHVVVIPDNDAAGMMGAHKIAAALRGVVASSRVLELPDLPAKGDVSDFIATFNDNDREAAAERLAIMAADAPLFDGDGEQLHPPEGRVVELVSAATITPERTTYVWIDRVVAGDVNLLVGPPGVGKGNITVGWAARLTRGDLDGDLYRTPRHVIIASAEDSPAHAIVPRLLAAGADMSRVHIVRVTDDKCEVCMTLPDDVPELVELVKGVDAALLIIDPLMAHLPARWTHTATHPCVERSRRCLGWRTRPASLSWAWRIRTRRKAPIGCAASAVQSVYRVPPGTCSSRVMTRRETSAYLLTRRATRECRHRRCGTASKGARYITTVRASRPAPSSGAVLPKV